MPTPIRDQMIRALVDNRGHLNAHDMKRLVRAAEDEGMSRADARALLEPGRYLAVSPDLAKAGLSLEDLVIEPEALETARATARRLGLEAFPMLLEARGKKKPKTKMEKAAAKLRRALARAEDLGARANWGIKASGADLAFSTDVAGREVPALILDRPTFEDPAPRDLLAVPERRAAIVGAKTAGEVQAAVTAILRDEAAHLAAEGVDLPTANARFGVQGLRRTALFDGLRALVRDAGATAQLPGRERTRALGALVKLEESLITGRTFDMETGHHKNYWPYWSNYANALVKIAEQTPADSPERTQIDNRLRDIFRRKTVFGRQTEINERNFEQSANCALVVQPKDSPRPGHRVSLAEGSSEYGPKYEVLTVAKDGLPSSLAWFAGAKLYRDGDDLRFDVQDGREAGAKAPAGLADHLEARRVKVDDLTIRALEGSERPRHGISMDWDGNGTINVAKTFIGWWGHCHNEAPLNAMGVDPKRAVHLYREARGLDADHAAADFSPDDIWDIVGAFASDAESGFSTNGVSANTRVDETTFVGERNNGTHSLYLGFADGADVQLDAEIRRISERGAPDRAVASPMSRFRENLPAGDGTFSSNPDYVGDRFNLRDRDMIAVDVADRTMTLRCEYLTLDDHGGRDKVTKTVRLDPTKDEAVLLSEEILRKDRPHGGAVRQHYLNPKTREYSSADVEVKAGDSGGYVREETFRTAPKKVKDLVALAETSYDSAEQIHGFVSQDIGLPFTFDTDPGKAVWNYPVRSVRIDHQGEVAKNEGGRDFTYTSYKLHYATMGGPTERGSDHRYVLKRDEAGQVVDAVALDPMPDFAYRKDHWVCAPVVVDAYGRKAVNLKAKTAGYLGGAGADDADGALWRRQADLLYAGLRPQKDGAEAPAYVYEMDDGTLVAFSDPLAFEAAKKADLKLRALEAGGEAVDIDDGATGCCGFWGRLVA